MTKTFCDICEAEAPIYREQLLTLTELGNTRRETYELCLDCVKNIAKIITQQIEERKNIN